MRSELSHVFPDTAAIVGGRLTVGGCDAVSLAAEHGTPLVVLDRATFENRARQFAEAVGDPARIFYAGKAFLCVALCRLVDALGLGLDVCSGGELATAVAAGFPAERIEFHGNNKSLDELEAARDAGVGRIVLDSFDEMERVEEAGLRARTLIRVTPGVEAHTHEFIQTGQGDSKFGFTLSSGVALEAIGRAMQITHCELTGVHVHIGSQILDLGAFDVVAGRIAGLLSAAERRFGFAASELNLGGGFGIAYVPGDLLPNPPDIVAYIKSAVRSAFEDRGLREPLLSLEPGRSLVGAAGVTLYTIGTVKEVPVAEEGSPGSQRVFVAVDGGMGDNIRPALYRSAYTAVVANRVGSPPQRAMTVVGKYCESGDFLIDRVDLPNDVSPGDLLAVPATGAYTYSMASNYNRNPRPAVVMVDNGRSRDIVRRETEADLLRLDVAVEVPRS